MIRREPGAGPRQLHRLAAAPDTLAQALLDYVDLGVSTLLIRGYDPLEDATEYGRDLIPLVRAEVARGDHAQAGVAHVRVAGPGAEAEPAGGPERGAA